MRALFTLGALLPALVCAQATLPDSSTIINTLPPRCIGPSIMGGRIADISVYEKEPRIFFVATAAGGLFKTENGGMTLSPVYQKGKLPALGAVALSQADPNLVWIGAGEASSRNSTSWGDGVSKSTDGGQTWTHMGLAETHHISRIIIDPKDSNTVYVAALGRLWGPNPDRGLYKTTDGGKTWTNVLFVDNETGVIDLIMDPSNNKTLIAACWQRMRYPWTWISGGPSSAMMKSTDAGKTWKKITKGMPPGNLGRIGLNYYRKNSKIVIATIENNGGGGLYRSKDGGESWERVNPSNPRPFYFSLPRQDPNDENRLYVPGVSITYSDDAGKTLRTWPTSVHVDHHAFWINPNDSNHIIIGQDGGVGQTRDKGKTWEHLNYMPIGQFYAVAADMRKPYYVYGGLQDNGSWAGPTQTLKGGPAFFDWYNIGGGDGFHVQVDPEDWTTAYSESQGGAIARVDQKTGASRFIQPRPASGEPRYRFNWSSPIFLSPHNSKTVYFGGNKLFKSVNRGDNWKVVSPDLTTNNPEKQKPGVGSVSPENTGAENHCTIITISESPAKQGVLWVGTDDGQVQTSPDDGVTWTNVTANISGLPANTWCSRVIASKYDVNRAYATFDGHRTNDFNVYVYVTEDMGKTWRPINKGIPVSNCAYVIREGLRNGDLLYLGTEAGLWLSLDRGENWSRYDHADWPTVPVHDVVLHPRDGDLVIATHGRSIWTIPVGALEDMTKDNLAKDVVVSKPAPVYLFGNITGAAWDGSRVWVSNNTQPGTHIAFYCKADMGDAKVTIQHADGEPITTINSAAKAGLNVVKWNARGGRGRILSTGDYRVVVRIKDQDYITSVRVEDVSGNLN